MKSILRFTLLAGIAVVGLILTHSNSKVVGAPALDGKAIFTVNCAVCHQPSGQGGGPYPPLAGNSDVNAVDSASLIRTVLDGRTGPITVNGQQYSGNMPSWRNDLSDAQIAAVLTYVRTAWRNSAPAVSEDQVAAARAPASFERRRALCCEVLGVSSTFRRRLRDVSAACGKSRRHGRRSKCDDRRDRQRPQRPAHRQRQGV